MKRFPLAISIVLLLCFYANAQSGVDHSTTQDGTYTNPDFGFSFKYPKDWTVHGAATNERIMELGKEKLTEAGALSKPSAEVAIKNTYHLLTVFRHPVGTPGITFNPAILVLAEKIDYAPGIKNGKDYLLNVRAILTKAGGHQILLKEPLEYHFAGTQFFRDNHTAEVNGVHMAQSYFATVSKGYALVFIFLGEDEKSVNEMSKAMETFAIAGPEH